MEERHVCQSVLYTRISLCGGNVKSILQKKISEFSLVLQNRHRLVRAAGRQAHFFRNVCRGNYTRVAGKGHYSVYLKLASRRENRIHIDYTDVAVFIRIFVSDIVGEIIAGNNVQPKLVSRIYNGECVSRSAEYHQFFHNSTSVLVCFFFSMFFAFLSSILKGLTLKIAESPKYITTPVGTCMSSSNIG